MADYFVRYNVTDGEENLDDPIIAYRIYDEGDARFYERFDIETKAWVHDPKVLWDVSGMGGDGDYLPTPVDEMEGVLKSILARGKKENFAFIPNSVLGLEEEQ